MAATETHESAKTSEMITVKPAVLAEYTSAIFVAAGAPGDIADRLAASLVDSNQAGHDSHGAIRISQYVREIRSGKLVPTAEPMVLRGGPAWALVDGSWGFGHETARFAMAQAIARAARSGVAVVLAVRCNHIGRVGEWAEQAAAAGMFGMASVALGQTPALMVAPFGGAGRALSTNPIAMGAPRPGLAPMLLDFATSISPEGKVRVARDKGVPLPAGCLVDKNGEPTTDPNALYDGGALLPVGGHKGYALSMMVEVLCMALSGADEPDLHGPAGENSGSFYLAIDPSVFRPVEAYGESIERLVRRVKAVPPASGVEEVLLPGEPEQRTRIQRADAISLPAATWQAIADDAKTLGVAVPSVGVDT